LELLRQHDQLPDAVIVVTGSSTRNPADYPGDPNLPPEESIQCRCAIAFEEAS
jgi:hypothetical protein